MALQEGQFQVRDLLLGPDTVYRVLSQTNPFTRQTRANQSGERAWNHGSWSGAEWAEEATVPMRILIDTDNTAQWMSAHQALTKAFRPVGESPTEEELRFTLGGREYVMFGRPRMVEPETNLIGLGKGYTRCAFVALDPVIYAGQETVIGPLSPPTYAGGLSVAFTVPLSTDAKRLGGEQTLTHDGTAEVGLKLRIDGPVLDPSIAVEFEGGSSQMLKLDIELISGQWLDIDTAEGSVILDGVVSRRNRVSGEFPMVPEGTHKLVFRTADANPASSLSGSFRPGFW